MKKLILLALLCAPAFPGSSQPYHRLIRTGAYWDCSWAYNPYGGTGCATTIDRIFFTGADTVLDGIAYRISYAYPMHSDPPNAGKCPPYAVDPVAADYKKYVREDTVARKVYIYNPIFMYPFDQVLYDFSLKPGDTLRSTYQGDLVVTNVDSVMIATGEYRKRFFLSKQGYGSSYYVEGIGGAQGLFTTLFTFESYGVFLCLKENNLSLWGSTCDSWFVSVPDHGNLRPVIYPNPSTDRATIDFNNDGHRLKFIEITDTRDVRMKEIRTTEDKVILDLGGYARGIYLVRITTGGSVYCEKICRN